MIRERRCSSACGTDAIVNQRREGFGSGITSVTQLALHTNLIRSGRGGLDDDSGYYTRSKRRAAGLGGKLNTSFTADIADARAKTNWDITERKRSIVWANNIHADD